MNLVGSHNIVPYCSFKSGWGMICVSQYGCWWYANHPISSLSWQSRTFSKWKLCHVNLALATLMFPTLWSLFSPHADNCEWPACACHAEWESPLVIGQHPLMHAGSELTESSASHWRRYRSLVLLVLKKGENCSLLQYAYYTSQYHNFDLNLIVQP